MTLPSSGTISIDDLRTEFSGPTPSSLSDYYRGGTYVPATGTAREPATGYNFSLTSPTYIWRIDGTYSQFGQTGLAVYWNNINVFNNYYGNYTYPPSSVTVGSATYYGGTYQSGSASIFNYSLYRTTNGDINTGVPTSGTISLGDFYGASA
jgi:hypothetical protein